MTDNEWYLELKKDHPTWSDEELRKELKKEKEDMASVVTLVVEERTTLDLLIQFEAMILLIKNPTLVGIYLGIKWLAQVKWLQRSQIEMAEFFGLSENTYKKYLNQLIKLKLIKIEKPYRRKIYIYYYGISRIDFKEVVGVKFQNSYLEKVKYNLNVYSPEFILEQEKQEEFKQAQLKIDGLVKEKVKEIVKEKVEKKKKEEKKFDPKDYTAVLTAYSKYKNIGLQGGEIPRAKHAIKQMFLSERSVKDIIGCMKLFSKLKDDPEYKWLSQWTLETVMKKMPEYVAGEIKIKTWEDFSRPL